MNCHFDNFGSVGLGVAGVFQGDVMLLRYARRGRLIRVSRPPAAGERRGIPIATIDFRGTTARILDGVAASAEETREIEAAVRELASTDPEKRAATFGYPEATGSAMKYYLEKATGLDKQLIEGAVRGAFKTLRKAQPPKPKVDSAEPKPAVVPISPEVVAEALYRAFAANSKAKVKGEPGASRHTEIRGFWDLHEVARKILSRA